MGDKAGIIAAIQQITKTRLTDKVYIAACSVDSVDQLARTCNCTAIDGKTQAEFTDVQLMAEVDDGELKLPTVGSTVIIAYSEYVLPFVLLYSEIDQIIYFGGDLGGLVKVIDLTTKLNNLENDINNLKDAFNAWTPVADDGGAALKAASATWAGESITPTEQSDIENTNILQG